MSGTGSCPGYNTYDNAAGEETLLCPCTKLAYALGDASETYTRNVTCRDNFDQVVTDESKCAVAGTKPVVEPSVDCNVIRPSYHWHVDTWD